MLFGAGHVGKALVPILAQLPCQVTWVDSRAEQFPANIGDYENVVMLISDSPEFEVNSMPANSYFIVMTHNHQMDFDITQAVLKRADFHYLGLIASETKWRRFQQRYKHRDIAAEQVARMNCPIGLRQVGGKLPIEVAVSVSAEIIHTYQAQQAKFAKQEQARASLAFASNNQQHAKVKPDVKMRAKSQQGVHWQALKPLIPAD